MAAPLALALVLAACDDGAAKSEMPKPQEITQSSIGHFCGMSLSEHPGPKGQIFVADSKEPIWFASVRETFAFTILPEEPKNVTAIYVSDMGKATNWQHPEAGTWTDARKAYYVIDGRRHAGLEDDDAVPFADETTATRYAAERGGRIVRFAEMPQDFILHYGDTDATATRDETGPQQARTP
jgi:copper chaperone NosL